MIGGTGFVVKARQIADSRFQISGACHSEKRFHDHSAHLWSLNTLAPLGERVARDGVFTSRCGSGEGVHVCYSHGEKSPHFEARSGM
ncbi:hypothetical protein SBA2_450109 [Acidobacteriia bacterium SbA2]|nr:hypothetical protein SBA2_450109 [Acidobacteriia bacterium SbA2]